MAKEAQDTTTDSQEKAAKPEPNPQVVAALQSAHKLYNDGKLEESEAQINKGLAIEPDHFELKYSLGVVYRDQERLEDSIKLFHSLSDKQPLRQAGVNNNLGVLHNSLGRCEEAIEYYRKAVDREFQFSQAHLNLGFTLLKLGQFKEGWQEHEWRWQTDSFEPVRCLQPRWDGSKLAGTILVHAEQGAGDTFQFIRFMPKIRERCDKVLLMLPDHLRSTIHGDQWADEFLTAGTVPLDRFQAILPLMSAPYALELYDNFAAETVAYLTPEERSIDLGQPHVADTKVKVGIAWGGSVTHVNNRFRSCSLEQLSPLFEVPNVSFYSLQKGPQVDQLKELGNEKIRDTDPLQNDFADAAAIMKQMNLIITVDTSILHLGGGLGLPTWGLLSQRADWRWALERTDSDWYPTLKLYRQQTTNDWDELVKRVAADLKKVASGELSVS